MIENALEAVSISRADAYNRAKLDLNFFAALLIPRVCTVAFPVYYQFLWQQFTSLGDADKVVRFVLGLPRGHAKTTFVKLLICYCILYDKYFFILIICANEPLAQNVLEDIETMLNTDQVISIYGGWKVNLIRDTKTLKRGPHNGHDKIIAALGSGSSLRGINIANRRPDFIFCDDMQTRDCALSPTESSSLYTWFLGTVLKARNYKRCLIIYVGNMYNQDCILYKLKMHSGWQSFITSAILQTFEPLWPEYFTIEELLADYEHDLKAGHPEIWFAEVMNIPIGGSNSLLQDNKLPLDEVAGFEEPLASFLTIDPASFRKTSDDNVIAGHSIYPGARYQVEDIVAGIMTPDEVVLLTVDMAIKLKAHYVFIETVAYQQILKWYFEQELLKLPGLDIEIRELYPKGRHKTNRILAFFNSVAAGGYYISHKVRSKVLYQALGFNMSRTDNKDDILDDIAYGLDIKTNHELEVLAYQGNLQQTFELPVAGVQANNSFLDRGR